MPRFRSDKTRQFGKVFIDAISISFEQYFFSRTEFNIEDIFIKKAVKLFDFPILSGSVNSVVTAIRLSGISKPLF